MIINHACKYAFLILGMFIFNYHLNAAEIKHIDSKTLRLVGEIEVGDSMKLGNLLKRTNRGDIGYGWIELSSPGGAFIEGIRLGYLFKEFGIKTRIKSNDICLSSCAIAFLGGTMHYGNGSSAKRRELELGGTIGFHGFYINSTAEKKLQESDLSAYFGVELSKAMAGILAGYAADMDIRSLWISEILEKGKNELHFVNTIGDALDLGIEIVDLSRVTTLESSHAINACNAATGKTGWNNNDGLVTAKKLSSIAAKKVVLEHITSGTLLHDGLIFNEIEESLAANDTNRIHKMYSELEYLHSIGVPVIELDNREIFHVEGFNVAIRGLQGCIVADTMDIVLLSAWALYSPSVGSFTDKEKHMIVHDRSQLLSGLRINAYRSKNLH